MENKTIEFIALEKLQLDSKNPRLPVSYRGATDDKIIEWMLSDASIIELMLAIGQNDFFIGEALLVVNNNDGYIVVEGNRRLTSLKLLQNPSLASIHTKKIQQVIEETSKRPNEIPCIIFPSRKEIMQYLGYRHITGIKTWPMLAKARHLNSLIPTLEGAGLNNQSIELAKKIGSRKEYVKRILVSYDIYEIIEDNNFYKIPNLDETSFHFNYIADSLRHDNIKNFININLNEDNTLSKLNQDNLRVLIDVFFRKNSENRSRVLGNSDNLTKLNKVLSNPEVAIKFIEGLPLQDAVNLIEVSSDTFYHEIMNSLKSLKTANSYIHQVKGHNSSDVDSLKEIIDLCRVMQNTIQAKEDRQDD